MGKNKYSNRIDRAELLRITKTGQKGDTVRCLVNEVNRSRGEVNNVVGNQEVIRSRGDAMNVNWVDSRERKLGEGSKDSKTELKVEYTNAC